LRAAIHPIRKSIGEGFVVAALLKKASVVAMSRYSTELIGEDLDMH